MAWAVTRPFIVLIVIAATLKSEGRKKEFNAREKVNLGLKSKDCTLQSTRYPWDCKRRFKGYENVQTTAPERWPPGLQDSRMPPPQDVALIDKLLPDGLHYQKDLPPSPAPLVRPRRDSGAGGRSYTANFARSSSRSSSSRGSSSKGSYSRTTYRRTTYVRSTNYGNDYYGGGGGSKLSTQSIVFICVGVFAAGGVVLAVYYCCKYSDSCNYEEGSRRRRSTDEDSEDSVPEERSTMLRELEVLQASKFVMLNLHLLAPQRLQLNTNLFRVIYTYSDPPPAGARTSLPENYQLGTLYANQPEFHREANLIARHTSGASVQRTRNPDGTCTVTFAFDDHRTQSAPNNAANGSHSGAEPPQNGALPPGTSGIASTPGSSGSQGHSTSGAGPPPVMYEKSPGGRAASPRAAPSAPPAPDATGLPSYDEAVQLS